MASKYKSENVHVYVLKLKSFNEFFNFNLSSVKCFVHFPYLLCTTRCEVENIF